MTNKKLGKRVVNSGILPNEQQEFLLKACLLEGDEAINNFEQWFASYPFPKYSRPDSKVGLPVMYDKLDGGSQRMLSLLYKNQLEAGNTHPVIKMLEGYYKYVWYRNQLLKSEYQKINAAFVKKGIQSVVFKGIALSERYYKDYGARPAFDIDLHIKEQDWKESISVLYAMGWVSKFGNPYDLPNSDIHAHTFENGKLEIDLHYRVNHYHFTNQTKEQIWESRQRSPNDFILLSSPVELLITLLHGLSFNLIPSIRWVADSVMILKTFSPKEWERFVSIIKEEENAAIISIALNYLKDNEFYPVPSEIIQRVDQLNTSKLNHKFFLLGIRKNINDFKIATFSIYRISKSNNWNPLKTIIAISNHYKYLWAVNNNWKLMIVLIRRLMDKVFNPKRVITRDLNRKRTI